MVLFVSLLNRQGDWSIKRLSHWPKISDTKEWKWDLNLSRQIPELTLFRTEPFGAHGSKLQITVGGKLKDWNLPLNLHCTSTSCFLPQSSSPTELLLHRFPPLRAERSYEHLHKPKWRKVKMQLLFIYMKKTEYSQTPQITSLRLFWYLRTHLVNTCRK